MTVRELQERMTPEELMLWSAHYALEDKAMREAERKAKSRRR